MDNRSEVLTRFLKDTADHKMTVLRDDENYRHLRCQKPGTWCYGFDIVTWPGYLAISGDMGAAVFTRTENMVEFFRTPDHHHEGAGGLYINVGYWSEKCVASEGERFEFVPAYFEQYVKERFDDHVEAHSDEAVRPDWADELWEELQSEVIGAAADDGSLHGALIAMDAYGQPYSDPGRFGGFSFSDVWEAASSLRQYTFHWIWRLYAISWAVLAYDAIKREAPANG